MKIEMIMFQEMLVVLISISWAFKDCKYHKQERGFCYKCGELGHQVK